jgi:hypothetical protein
MRRCPMTSAAFFDLDNTLIKGSALFHSGAGMARHGLVSRREIVRYAAQHVAYRWRGENVGESRIREESPDRR